MVKNEDLWGMGFFAVVLTRRFSSAIEISLPI